MLVTQEHRVMGEAAIITKGDMDKDVAAEEPTTMIMQRQTTMILIAMHRMTLSNNYHRQTNSNNNDRMHPQTPHCNSNQTDNPTNTYASPVLMPI